MAACAHPGVRVASRVTTLSESWLLVEGAGEGDESEKEEGEGESEAQQKAQCRRIFRTWG
jgi:hypothetical protein